MERIIAQTIDVWPVYALLCGNITAIFGNALAVVVGLIAVIRYDLPKN